MSKTFAVLSLLASVSYSTLAFAAPSADDVLAANKAASGRWDGKAALKIDYAYSGQGMTGKLESLDDLGGGRWVDNAAIGPSIEANGFDGSHAWMKDPSGAVTPQDGGDERQLAVNDGYRRANIWWRADRGGAAVVSDGEKTDGEATYEVLTVTPKDGKNFDAWFDAKSHLLSRVVEVQGAQTFTTVYSGYKEFEGAELAVNTSVSNGDAKYDQHVTITAAAFLPAQPPSTYAMPKVVLTDTSIAGGSETTFPFKLINNHIYADVTVNGKPFQFIFDTGGVNLVTPATAKELGLKSEGQFEANGTGAGHMDAGVTKVSSVRLGNATIKDQSFVVIPLDAMANVEGVGMPGMIGFETFRRFVTRVDYGAGTLTLIDPKTFDPKNSGTPVPFTFDGNTIEVQGVYNGVPGNFTVDTGSRASLTLNSPFVAKNNIGAGTGKSVEMVTGWGIGGASRAIAMRGDTLRIGDSAIQGPVVELSTDKGGDFTAAAQAGNIGAGILKRYIVTLDYEHSTLYLKPNTRAIADLDTFDRAGIWFNKADDGYTVVDVTKGAPADAAGIKTGDEIVAVDGKSATGVPIYELRKRLRDQAPGTIVTFTVRSGGATHDVRVTLRDLI